MNECRTISNDGTWMSYHLKWWYSHGKRIYGNVGSSDPKVSSLIHLTTHSHSHIGSSILALHSARYSFSGTLRFLADLSFSQIFIQWNSLVPGRFDWCFPFSPSETFGLHWLMFSTFHFVQISSNLSIPTFPPSRPRSWKWESLNVTDDEDINLQSNTCSFEPYLRDGITTWLYARWLRAFTRAFCMCLRASPGLSFSILCRTWCRGSKKTLF